MLLALYPAYGITPINIESDAEKASFVISVFDASSNVNVLSEAESFAMQLGFADSYGSVVSIKKAGGSSKHRKAIMRDDEDLLLCIYQYMCIASNN